MSTLMFILLLFYTKYMRTEDTERERIGFELLMAWLTAKYKKNQQFYNICVLEIN